jgi:alpha-D-ribose 1-methylphosphonate 5-triphosphate diphosphatase
MSEMILTNARIVLAEVEILGTVHVRDGAIAAIDSGTKRAPGALDLDGDYLLPGLVELHTDNVEKHTAPRPGVTWPTRAAILAHDAQIAAAGITTVFDALALGDIFEGSSRVRGLQEVRNAIAGARDGGLLKAEHLLHLRCELSFAQVLDLYEALMDDPAVRLVSIMDHTPGERQFVDVERYRYYYMKKYGISDDEFAEFLAARRADQEKYSARHRRAIVERARARGHILASHDDATIAHVEESAADGMKIAEFPTTTEAARASHAHGMTVLMGGPNVVLGQSQSGNVSARALATEGLLDIVSSDYVPCCLADAPFILAESGQAAGLPAAVRMVSKTPAEAAGLRDRGEIAVGKRADLVRLRRTDGLSVVRTVWREGMRIV